ncbi:MAG: STAS domain-containing protein [Victivallales bacterium]|nr:STAS domain-containing protein [Victivallales bacterium]
MKKADLLIAHTQGVYTIKVDGRANFECSPPIRNLANNLDKDLQKISIDLTGCSGMDSTFMGVLAMLGLQTRNKAVVEIVNAGTENRHLLEGLGIQSLFSFVEKTAGGQPEAHWSRPEAKADAVDRAETVYTAHDTLIRANETVNRPKFEKVVEFAKKDLDKLKKEQEKQ